MDQENRKPDAAEPIVVDDAFDFELFRAKHQRNIVISVTIAVVIAVVGVTWITVDHYRTAAAEALFASASDLSGWQNVIAKYPHSEPAASAYFLAAAGLRDAGKVDDSTALYHKFLTEFPENPLGGGALVGIGQNLELQGKTQDAVDSYSQAHTQYPKSYAAPFAMFCQAGVLIRESKIDDARRVLTDLVAEYQDAAVGQIAQAQLDRLESISAR